MEYAEKGAQALTASDPVTAITEYTKALIEHPTSPDYFVQRAIAYTRTKPPRHDLALQDAEWAVLYGQKRGKRDKIQAAQQRRVVALYNLGRYSDAKVVLDTMKRWRPENSKPQQMEHQMWLTKIEAKLSSSTEPATVKEYPDYPAPEEKAMKKLLQAQLKADGGGEHEPAVKKDPSKTTTASPAQASSSSTQPSQPTLTPTTLPKIRHEWYQSPTSIIITIYAKNIVQHELDVEIRPDNVIVTFPHSSDRSTRTVIPFEPLFALIDPSKSSHKLMSTKIEITLAKDTPGTKWPAVTGTRSDDDSAAVKAPQQIPLSSAPVSTAPSYPTSSRNGPKDWDKLASNLTKKPAKKTDGGKAKAKAEDAGSDSEPEEDEGGYESDAPGDEVDGFFKKLYAGADPDTRRAMMKSFTESNGTALSTNWSEVGSKKVDVVRSKEEEDAEKGRSM